MSHPDGSDTADVAGRLAELRHRIAAVDRRIVVPVSVVAVTKGFDSWAIEAAVAAGCDAIGENYAQELIDKADTIERLGPEVHFIGRLQRNKVRQLVGIVDVWCSLDRASIVDEVAKRTRGARVLVQVDPTGDPDKGGCSPHDVPALVERARARGLDVAGLMTVGPTGEPPEAARPGFRTVRSLADELGLDVCSMGMTGDLEVAVQEGSTEVRVGTALFGERPPRR